LRPSARPRRQHTARPWPRKARYRAKHVFPFPRARATWPALARRPVGPDRSHPDEHAMSDEGCMLRPW